MAEKTYYEILGVPPKAAKPEMDRAYLARKSGDDLEPEQLWELERAYATLSDPNLKRKYDTAQSDPQRSKKPKSAKDAARRKAPRLELSPAELKRQAMIRSAVLAALVLAIAVQAWSIIGWRLITYDAGNVLVYRIDDTPFGAIVKFEGAHTFKGGMALPAYLVRMSNSGKERWLPKGEVNQLAKAAK